MAFRFRLQRVLDYRRRQAEMAEMELAKAQRYLTDAEAELEQLNGRRVTALDELARGLHKGSDGAKIQLWRVYVTDLEMRIEEQNQKVEALRLTVAEVRSRLMEATQRKKAMESLRSHKQASWQRDENRREEKDLTELATQRMTGRIS